MVEDRCYSCGETYERVGQHWFGKQCDHPPLSEEQHEIIKGLLMGDGCLVGRDSGNPSLTVSSTKMQFTNLLTKKFPYLTCSISTRNSAEQESAMVEGNISNSYDKGKYNASDIYIWRLMSLPSLKKYAGWYFDKKVWPEDLNVTAKSFKYWYCGDGCLQDNGNSPTTKISLDNEHNNEQKIMGYFSNTEIPKPDSFNDYEYDYGSYTNIIWNKDKSERLFETLGDPLPGFKYKWPM